MRWLSRSRITSTKRALQTPVGDPTNQVPGGDSVERCDVSFPSSNTHCAAWVYRPKESAGPVPCIVMSHGYSLTRHDGLSSYAEALVRSGAAVLVYDHRYFGDSGGCPR